MTLSVLRFLARSLAAVGVLALFAATANAELVEGKNYVRMQNPHPVETGKQIEVIEFFSYGCPHCAALEPYLDTWLEKKQPCPPCISRSR